MRLSIDGGGYATAATAFADANQVAALQHDSLTGKLGSYAAMAGDDATSAAFATAYDETAGEAVHALGDLVTAFANLGRLTEQSLAHHRNANAASVMSGSIITGSTVYEGAELPDSGYVSVLPATLPSSLGGDPPLLSFQENWILDHVEGFVWPNADTARLRDAAHLWRSAAEGLDHLATYCDGAVRGFDSQRSPEIPVAIDATTTLRRTIDDLAAQYAALAVSCESFALEVDAAHERTRALLREILAMVVEGVIISVAIGLISAGAGAIIGGSSVVARVAAQSPRFAAILTTLRAAAATSTHGIRTARTNLRAIRSRLDRYLGLPVRTESGHLTVAGISRWRRGWLAAHEHSGGHTLSRHVGASIDDLLERLRQHPRLSHVSSFADQEAAERSLSRLLTQNHREVSQWLAGASPRLRLDSLMSQSTGISVSSGGQAFHVSGIRAILVRDSSMPDGFRILTSFPQP